MVKNKEIVLFFLGALLIIASLGFIASSEYNEDNGCYPYDLDRLSYSTRDTGDVILLAGYNEFNSENVKFTHGNIYEGRTDNLYKGKGSIYGSATTKDGKEMKLNVRTSVSEIIENNCDRITWRNTGKGTYWIKGKGKGTTQVEYDSIDITYYPKEGKINVVGVGDVDFEFEGMTDNRFEAGSIPPVVPEFGAVVGVLTILSALGVFFVIRKK